MPAIDVTLSDGDVAVDVTANVGYSDAQARNALDGETVTPGQVGTESDPVDESHTTVQHSQELSVSDSTTVTGGPIGTQDEWIPLESRIVNYKAQTSSTTYSEAVSNSDRVLFDLSHYSITNLQNLKISGTVNIQQATSGETASFVLSRGSSNIILSDSEVTVESGYNQVSTPRVSIPTSGVDMVKYDLKTSGGTAVVFNDPVITLWGQVQ